MDQELIARNIMNIIDIKNQFYYDIFMHEDLYEVLKDYLENLTRNIDYANKDIEIIMENNKSIISKLIKDNHISVEERNQFMGNLMSFKRKYLLQKK